MDGKNFHRFQDRVLKNAARGELTGVEIGADHPDEAKLLSLQTCFKNTRQPMQLFNIIFPVSTIPIGLRNRR